MRQNGINIAIFLVLVSIVGVGWYYAEKKFFPPPPPVEKPAPKPTKDEAASLGGYTALFTGPHDSLKTTPIKNEAEKKPDVPPVVKPVVPSEPMKLIALGGENYRKKVLLNNKGGSIQQIVLNGFDEADRAGRVVKDDAGNNRKLHLLPGYQKIRFDKLTEKQESIELKPGLVSEQFAKDALIEPSYTIFHYATKGDPNYNEESVNYPLPELGTRIWKIAKEESTSEGKQTVAFETELDAPYFLKLRKTFTLEPKSYHIGFQVDIEPLPGRTKDSAVFRYQIAGARSLPIEGEWYTQTFHNAYLGKQDPNKPSRFYRDFADSATINTQFGSEMFDKASTRLVYASVGTQFFTSTLALNVRHPECGSPWASARATREINTAKPPALPQIEDITIRAIAEPLSFDNNKPVSHHYIIYNGPIKIQLLGKLKGDEAVDADQLKLYTEELGMTTMTDYHSPIFIGKFSNAIGWTSAIIFFTNIMHTVLCWLHAIVPIWGLDIILLTIMVRTILFPFSRRQQRIFADVQAKMQAHQPEIDKLKEKYKNDMQAFNQAKTKYMLENGLLNPKAQLSGCLLLFAQMPIFMGLYFCLQESIFFRLSPFMWINNLAAPDMLAFWTESIPMISSPENRIGFWSFLYLGPYFNLLPIISVTLMFIHTKLTMPPAMDEMQEQQQKMMKFMMIFMGLFFYKMAAGLALYFICSTLWGLAEKKFIPKPVIKPVDLKAETGKPKTGFMANLMKKMEEMQKLSENQRQIRNEPRDDRKKKK